MVIRYSAMMNTSGTENGNHLVQSVTRAIGILEALGEAQGGLGVTELARRLKLKVPTVHNLLRTLSAHGYVAKDRSTQRYRLGLSCARLARAYVHALRVPEAARPVIEELALRLNESVIVAVMEHGEIAFVARAAGNRMLSVNFERSWVKVGYTSVCGRVLLAYLSKAELERYIATHPIDPTQLEDIQTRDDLDRILEQARRDGHLEYWREHNTALAIAAPIRDYTGDVVASVGLGMPAVRFRESEREVIVGAVKEAARKISEEMGWKEKTDTGLDRKEQSHV